MCHLQDQFLATELQMNAVANVAGLELKFQEQRGIDKYVHALSRRVDLNEELTALSACTPAWLQVPVTPLMIMPCDCYMS